MISKLMMLEVEREDERTKKEIFGVERDRAALPLA